MLRIASTRFHSFNHARIKQCGSTYPSLRSISTITHYPASAEATREVPTPLVFLSASRWDNQPDANQSFKAFIQHFTLQGWNVHCIDLDPFEGKNSIKGEKESGKILEKLESESVDQMRKLSGSGASGPFPPILVSQGISTLIAESYVSSNPLSGLALLNPPLNPSQAHQDNPKLLPTDLPAFTYEPRFPCLVAWSTEKVKELSFWDIHRIEEMQEDEADEALDRTVWDMENEKDQEGAGPFQLRKWAEENGISDQIQQEPIDVEELDSSSLVEEEIKEGVEDTTEMKKKDSDIPDWFVEGDYVRSKQSSKEPISLDENHLEESFIRGSGPGGQAINKLSTCVQLKHTPTGLVIRYQESRSRSQNRTGARRRMSKELERLVFGEYDSVLGREALRERRSKKKKAQKRRRREEEKAQSKDIS